MIEDIRQTILTSDFIFILILLGFYPSGDLALAGNRRITSVKRDKSEG